MNILFPNKFIFALIITIIFASFIALLFVFNQEYLHTNTTSNTISVKDYTYKIAVRKMKKILEEARNIYLNAIDKNETWKILIYKPYTNISKAILLNTTIINETTLVLGNTTYNYIIVHVYDSESKLNFMPQRVQVNNMVVELLPKNKSITYTGGVPYDYLLNLKNKSYRISFLSIGFVKASHYLTISVDKVSTNIYKVIITVTRELGNTKYVNTIWLILIRN